MNESLFAWTRCHKSNGGALMLERILSFIGGAGEAESAKQEDRLRLAAAALLVEMARVDEGADESERRRIAQLLAQRFSLSSSAAELLLQEAEEEADQSSQLFAYTREIKDAFDYDQRVQMIELLWEVAYADDRLHHLEANLMRRIAGLLHVEDRDSGEARKRVLARRG
jgi:uncharacterized tellurite resistance protein B-like protein